MGVKDHFKNLVNRGVETPPRLKSVELSSVEADIDEITRGLEHERSTREGMGKFLKHPFRVLTEEPLNILIVSVPLALIVFIGGFISMVASYGIQVLFTSTVIDDFIVFAVLIAIIPVAFLDFKEQWRIKSLENALPNFFRDLAGMNDSGMTLPNAVHIVASAEYSTLTPHIRKLDQDMSWGSGFVESMYRFGKELGTPLADRSVDLIAKASKAGGDISEVLRAAAKDTFEVVNLAQERSNNMLIYVIICTRFICSIPVCYSDPCLHIFNYDGHGRGFRSFIRSTWVYWSDRPFRLQAIIFACGIAPGVLFRTCSRSDGRRPAYCWLEVFRNNAVHFVGNIQIFYLIFFFILAFQTCSGLL